MRLSALRATLPRGLRFAEGLAGLALCAGAVAGVVVVGGGPGGGGGGTTAVTRGGPGGGAGGSSSSLESLLSLSAPS